jgi:hypothetical protein
MATTKRHLNPKTVQFTPDGGSATPITGVQSVALDHRGNSVMHSGDDDRYPTMRTVDFQDPQAVVTHRDLTAANGLSVGARGVFEFDHHDARYGSTTASGGYTATLDQAILTNKTTNAQHRQLGEGVLTFESESADGTTNPLSYAAL